MGLRMDEFGEEGHWTYEQDSILSPTSNMEDPTPANHLTMQAEVIIPTHPPSSPKAR